MTGLLPTNYEVPESGSGSVFLKLQNGTNQFRILDVPLTGYVWFEETPDGLRPKRTRDIGDVPSGEKPKHFWFVPVAMEGSVKLIEITQKTILNELAMLDRSPVWGNLSGYEVIVTRSGDGLETTYSVQPCPKTPNDMVEKYAEFKSGYKPENLFSGLSVLADSAKANDGLPF